MDTPAAAPASQPPPLKRFAFFVDGFNVFHTLDVPGYRQYKWLDLTKLCAAFVPKSGKLEKVFYFTALAEWDQAKVARHKNYIKALELSGVEVVYGKFKRKTRRCKLCNREYPTHEEKQTDVNIATTILRTAVTDLYDTAVIVSGDSDLIPAIKAVRLTFAAKQFGVVIPIGRTAEELKQTVDFHQKMKERHLKSSQFPDSIPLDLHTALVRPPTWK